MKEEKKEEEKDEKKDEEKKDEETKEGEKNEEKKEEEKKEEEEKEEKKEEKKDEKKEEKPTKFSKDSIPEAEIIFKGLLEKEGSNVKSWKKRWFILTKDKLYYFEKENSKDIKGEFAFTDDTKVVSEFEAVSAKEKKHTNLFALAYD